MHRAKHFARIAVVGGRHAFLGGAQQRVGVGLPTDQDRLLVLEREPGRGQARPSGARNTEAGSSLALSRSMTFMAGFASRASGGLGDPRLGLGGFVHAEHLAQTIARAIDAALDRADGTAEISAASS